MAIGLHFNTEDFLVNFPTTNTQQKSEPHGSLSNPYYGWQPRIANSKSCSWRNCFEDGHNCSTCRDSVEEFGTAPATADNWIPDVTMLHRMMLAGKDADGQPWPPSLDLELCEDIGTDGSRNDVSKESEYKPGDRTDINSRPWT
jgi:hypothetical protein